MTTIQKLTEYRRLLLKYVRDKQDNNPLTTKPTPESLHITDSVALQIAKQIHEQVLGKDQ